MYNRFFERASSISEKFALSRDNAEHAAKVLRLRTGEKIVVCDGARGDFICTITDVSKGGVSVAVVERLTNHAEPKVPLTLFLSLTKGDKFEFVLQKCVELGAAGFVPFVSERSVVRSADNKIERWRKIAEGAAKQSGRGVVPFVREVVGFEDAVRAAGAFRGFAAYEGAAVERDLRTVINGGVGGEFCAFIGPEGGFSAREVELFERGGVELISLGRRVLRAETAPVALAACFFYETDR